MPGHHAQLRARKRELGLDLELKILEVGMGIRGHGCLHTEYIGCAFQSPLRTKNQITNLIYQHSISYLRSNIQGKPSIPVVVQLGQCLLSVRSLTLDGELILPRITGVNIALDLLAHHAGPETVPGTYHLNKFNKLHNGTAVHAGNGTV